MDPVEERNRKALKEKEKEKEKEEKDKAGEPSALKKFLGLKEPTPAEVEEKKRIEKRKKILDNVDLLIKTLESQSNVGYIISIDSRHQNRTCVPKKPSKQEQLLPNDEREEFGKQLSVAVSNPQPLPQQVRFDVNWVFLEIVSLLPDDSNIKKAVWENFTTSCALFSKLDDLERGDKGGKEIATLVLPFVISELHDLPLPGGDRARLALCELLCESREFITRCFFDGSEERKSGMVNQALRQIAAIDRKGLVVDQLLDLCRSFMSSNNFHKSEVIRTILGKYLKSEDDYSRTAVLSVLSAWISKLPYIELPDDPTAFGVDLMVFLVDVVEVCDRQAKAPLNEAHRQNLLLVFESLRKVTPCIFPPKDELKTWDTFLKGKKNGLMLAFLRVRECQNFSRIFSLCPFIRVRHPRHIAEDPAGEAVISLLFQVAGINLNLT